MEEIPEVNIATACRLCLINEEDEEMISIDNETYENIQLCGLKIFDNDELPNRICRNCHNILQFIHKFRKMCENSDIYLREFCCKQKSEKMKFESKEQAGTEKLAQTINEQEQQKELIPKDEIVQFEVELKDGDAEFLYEFDENANESTNEEVVFENNESVDEELWIEEACEQDDISNETIYIVSDNNPIENPNNIVSNVRRNQSKVMRISKDDTVLMKQTIKEESGERHVCEICGNRYKKLGALEAHRRRHQNQRQFECEICSMNFTFNFQLERHMRKHTGDRPFTCEFCFRKFVDRSTMSRHQKIHRNERAYKCDYCEKSFTYYSVLKTHIMSHTGEKPYCCGICSKSFHRASDLRNHLETLQHRKDPRAAILIKDIRPTRKEEWS